MPRRGLRKLALVAALSSLLAAPAAADAASWHQRGTPMTPRQQWNANFGYCGETSFIKAMINMLPKPKIKAPSSPFEEAQW